MKRRMERSTAPAVSNQRGKHLVSTGWGGRGGSHRPGLRFGRAWPSARVYPRLLIAPKTRISILVILPGWQMEHTVRVTASVALTAIWTTVMGMIFIPWVRVQQATIANRRRASLVQRVPTPVMVPRRVLLVQPARTRAQQELTPQQHALVVQRARTRAQQELTPQQHVPNAKLAPTPTAVLFHNVMIAQLGGLQM